MEGTLTREQKRMALAEVRIDMDSDLWGTTLAHLHGIADVLYHVADTPDHWVYLHPSGRDCVQEMVDCHAETGHNDCQCSYPDLAYVPFCDGEIGIQMLTYAGNVLTRYAKVLKRAERDY